MINNKYVINDNVIKKTLNLIKSNNPIDPLMRKINSDIISISLNSRMFFKKIPREYYFYIAEGYRTGITLNQSFKYAFSWYNRAKNVNKLSNFYIGEDYYLGLSRDTDLKQAKIYFKRCNENKSIYYLGIIKMIEEVSKPLNKRNYTDAYNLLVESFQKGYEPAIKDATMLKRFIKC